MIDFNIPYQTGKEVKYLKKALKEKKLSGNGLFTKKCQDFVQDKIGLKKALLTTSCTDALEMSALLINLQPGDEVIVPTYTFVSSALAFVREKAKIVFIDSLPNHPNMDVSKLGSLITEKTKAIVVVHYAGVAVDMDIVMDLAAKHNLYVIEDAAQAIDSMYKNAYLGSIGHMSTFSFHETKNIQCGEGGLLGINTLEFIERAEVIWEKGTNRAKFFRGEINKYGWEDIGSSFLASEITAAFLYAQLESMDFIQAQRIALWNRYYSNLLPLAQTNKIELPFIPNYATNNAHIFYIIVPKEYSRGELIAFMKNHEVHAVFHYLCLHDSDYYKKNYPFENRKFPNAQRFEKQLLRLPLYNTLGYENVDKICQVINEFFTE
jgi:dTDP-4-amino-4,6-dideoxygalactose transaminase